MVTAPATAQVRTLAGRVTDEVTGRPLAVGTVEVRGTGAVDHVRPDGVFIVRAPLRRVTLEVRSAGYQSRMVAVPIEQDVVMIALAPDPLRLESIELRGASGHVAGDGISAESLEKLPPGGVQEVIGARVAGAVVERNSHILGGDVRVVLRGLRSLSGASAPLYVIDGLVVSDVAIGSGITAVSRGQEPRVGRLVDLFVGDIERIEVLKGPTASLRFGPRAANGVVVITTKR